MARQMWLKRNFHGLQQYMPIHNQTNQNFVTQKVIKPNNIFVKEIKSQIHENNRLLLPTLKQP